MPLVWAHAEYLKLCRSLRDGEVFDRPPQTVQRYLGKKAATSRHIIWRFNNKVRTTPASRTLRVETLAKAAVRWSVDGWRTVRDTVTRDTTLGVHVADLPTTRLGRGDRVDLTLTAGIGLFTARILLAFRSDPSGHLRSRESDDERLAGQVQG
jgi:glucoamylase